MKNTKEIAALIKLLDDPDPTIFSPVQQRLMELGSEAISPLESAWEQSLDSVLQERIEQIVHHIQFNEVKQDLQLWYHGGAFDLLQGVLIINRYQYPDLDEQAVVNQLEEIKREIWLGLYDEMSALEKIKYFNHVFYQQFGFRGNTKNYLDPQNSYLAQVLHSKRGNQISLAIIYMLIAQRLDIPVYGINLPQHFILAYLDENNEQAEAQVLFYINAFNKGAVFGRSDINHFLKQLGIHPLPSFYEPCGNVAILQRILRNLRSAFEHLGAADKVAELEELQAILEPQQSKKP